MSASWEPQPVVTTLVLGHDALLGEVRGLYGAERQFLQALGLMSQTVRLSRVKRALGALVTGTGVRLWRLEELFALLDEEVCGRQSAGLLRIVEGRWMTQQHRLQYALLELHVVGTTLQEAAGHLTAHYAVAARRAESLGLVEAAAHLGTSRHETEAIGRLVAAHTGVHATSAAAQSVGAG